MNLKYYLRGIGTGIIAAALLFLVFNKPKELTDAEIKLRAAALGMVEDETLVSEADTLAENKKREDSMKAEKEEPVSEGQPASGEEPASEGQPASEEQPAVNSLSGAGVESALSGDVAAIPTDEQNIINDPEDPQLPGKKNDSTQEEAGEEREYVTLIVESGDVGKTVSTKLYEAGLIESIEEYNNFLSGNNYSYRIRAGEYHIPIGADHQEIANILCKIAEP